MSFKDALEFLLPVEGGYANDPDDPGGATNYGITQETYDAFRKRSVKHITPNEVAEIYEKFYWRDGKCDAIAVTHPHLALVHFDCAVNCGVIQAAKLLQKAVGATPDGIVGSRTLQAIRQQSDDVHCHEYLKVREAFYYSIVSNKPVLNKFLKSWLHRLKKLDQKIFPS